MLRFLTYAIAFGVAYMIVGPPLLMIAVAGLMVGAGLALAKRNGT